MKLNHRLSTGILAGLILSGVFFFSAEWFVWVLLVASVSHITILAVKKPAFDGEFLLLQSGLVLCAVVSTVLHVVIASGFRVKGDVVLDLVISDLGTVAGLSSLFSYTVTRGSLLLVVVGVVVVVCTGVSPTVEQVFVVLVSACAANVGFDVALRRPITSVSVWQPGVREVGDFGVPIALLSFEESLILFSVVLVLTVSARLVQRRLQARKRETLPRVGA